MSNIRYRFRNKLQGSVTLFLLSDFFLFVVYDPGDVNGQVGRGDFYSFNQGAPEEILPNGGGSDTRSER